jgi:hypothetical protein
MENKMNTYEKYLLVLQKESISLADIKALARVINSGKIRSEARETSDLVEYQSAWLRNESWNLSEEESAAKLQWFKKQVYSRDGAIRKNAFATSLFIMTEDPLNRIIKEARKMSFAGFFDTSSVFPDKFVKPVFRVSAKYSHFEFYCSMGDRETLVPTIVEIREFPPAEIICKGCKYYAGFNTSTVQLNCAVHPSGPNELGCSDWDSE